MPDTPQAIDANNPFINLREQKWMAMILDYTAKCFFQGPSAKFSSIQK